MSETRGIVYGPGVQRMGGVINDGKPRIFKEEELNKWVVPSIRDEILPGEGDDISIAIVPEPGPGILTGPDGRKYRMYEDDQGRRFFEEASIEDNQILPGDDMPQVPDEIPKGKPDFSAMGLRIGRIVEEKDRAYGDSVRRSAKIMTILYPHGLNPGDYIFALLNLRIIDKLCRSSSDPWAFGENPYDDIGGYAIRGSEIANERIAEHHKIEEGLG